MQERLSDQVVAVSILVILKDRACWGARYMPLDTLVNWLSKKVRPDGKKVRKIIKNLLRDGYLIQHKKGETISLNPVLSKEIADYIEKYIQRL